MFVELRLADIDTAVVFRPVHFSFVTYGMIVL